MVELAVHQAQQPTETTERTLLALEEGFPQTAEQAELFLEAAGLDAGARAALRTWALIAKQGEGVPRGHLAGLLEPEEESVGQFETRLRLLGVLVDGSAGVSLDGLTHRCLCTVFAAP